MTYDPNPREQVIAMLRRLPDDLTLEQIQYHVFVLQKAKRTREAIANGQVFTHEEAKERLKQWLIPEVGPA